MYAKLPERNPPHYPSHFHHSLPPSRHSTAQWCPIQRAWFQDGRELRSVKASKAFVWPKDGRNGTSWGRFKDIVQNKGPDMFLTINANKHDYMQNRPSRDRWTGLSNFTWWHDATPLDSRRYGPWMHKGGGVKRSPGTEYDFRTRKYGIPNRASWKDAIWQEPRKNKNNPYPEAYCDVNGDWFEDFHYRPWYAQGPASNEQGVGFPGQYRSRM